LILFDGTYRLQRQGNSPPKPIGKWACSWRLRIIDFSFNQPDVQHIRPYVVVATHTSEGIFKTTCAESMGKRICRDFDLKIDDILWIEHYPDEPALYVATSPKSLNRIFKLPNPQFLARHSNEYVKIRERLILED